MGVITKKRHVANFDDRENMSDYGLETRLTFKEFYRLTQQNRKS